MRIAVTSHYLDEADCHRGFTAQFDDFKLGSALHQIKDLPAAWSRKFLEQVWVVIAIFLHVSCPSNFKAFYTLSLVIFTI